MMVLLKICFPSFSLVMTVLNVCEPALMGGTPGRAPGRRRGLRRGCAELPEAAANNAADSTIAEVQGSAS